MKNTGESSLIQVFKRIPMLENQHPKEFKITQLESYTNKNYHIKNNSIDLILRLPRSETNQFINREAEIYNEQIAFKLGLTPACLWHNETGESLRRTITPSKSLSPAELRTDSNIRLVSKGLRLLHNSPKNFKTQANLQQLLSRYFELLNNQQQKKLRLRFNQALSRLQKLESDNTSLVPSHNDLNENNLLLDASNKLWFIDWEYSSMASPYWDLAIICNSGEYKETHCRQLLESYKHKEAHLNLQKLQHYRNILSVLNDCWMGAFNR